MDDRLKEVQTTDLTDSRVNHDFIDWLKTKGMNWLLLIPWLANSSIISAIVRELSSTEPLCAAHIASVRRMRIHQP